MSNCFMIPPQTGSAFLMKKGNLLKVTDVSGQQVSDLFCFDPNDHDHVFSSGRTIDYNESIFVTKGSLLYSNRSEPLLKIVEDTCGRHDCLMTPCSLKMFQIIAENEAYHPSCHENLASNLARFGFKADHVCTTFNIFMNVEVSQNGKLSIHPPISKPYDYVLFEAQRDLVVGLTACSHEESNNHSFKPIYYSVYKDLEGYKLNEIDVNRVRTHPKSSYSLNNSQKLNLKTEPDRIHLAGL